MTAAANGQPEPFDLDAAAKAAAAESTAVPFTFTYRGETYTVPHAMDWPLDAQLKIARGELNQALPGMLGAEQVARLSAAGMTLAELTVLFQAIGKQAGVDGLPNLPQLAAPGSTPT